MILTAIVVVGGKTKSGKEAHPKTLNPKPKTPATEKMPLGTSRAGVYTAG